MKKSLQMLMALSLFATAPAIASASGEVSLLYVRTGFTGQGSYAYGYVELKNLAYAKKVTALYQIGTGAWVEHPATYVAPTHDNLEAWSFATEPVQLGLRQQTTVSLKFRYEVAGQTFVDDNGGKLYKVGIGYDPTDPGLQFGQATLFVDYFNATLSQADDGSTNGKGLYAGVWVKGLTGAKQVQLVYSADNWQTVQYAAAAPQSTLSNGAQYWTVQLNVPLSTSSVVFAVQYTVNGASYWDNNFGQNFTLTY